MSVVTDIILMFSAAEDEKTRITEVWGGEYDGTGVYLVSVNDDTLPEGWTGGGRVFAHPTFIGSYNHFETKKIMEILENKVSWEYPEVVQLLIKEDQDYLFTMYRFQGKKLVKIKNSYLENFEE